MNEINKACLTFHLTKCRHFFFSSSFRDRGYVSAPRILGIILETDIWLAFYAVQLCELSGLLYNNPSLPCVEHFGPLWMIDVIWMGSVIITYVLQYVHSMSSATTETSFECAVKAPKWCIVKIFLKWKSKINHKLPRCLHENSTAT